MSVERESGSEANPAGPVANPSSVPDRENPVQLNESVTVYRLRIAAHIATIVSLFTTATMLLLTVIRLGETKQQVNRLGTEVVAGRLKVTIPQEGDLVILHGDVMGVTPHRGWNHYIVVTPRKLGANWVTDGPLPVDSGGVWAGTATYGGLGVGVGERFMVRCLATKTTIEVGALVRLPSDAILSQPVTVTRVE